MNDSSLTPQRRFAIYGLSLVTASSVLAWTMGGRFDALPPRLASAATKVEKTEKGSAAEKPQNAVPASEPSAIGKSAEAEIRTVKLNYTNKPWDQVLEDVATATTSELIMDRIPGGRYSRRDSNTYNRHEAVRILNKDIEPLGFRLLEKGDFLILIDLPGVQRVRHQPAGDRSQESGIRSQEASVRDQESGNKNPQPEPRHPKTGSVQPMSYEEMKDQTSTAAPQTEGRLADTTLVIYRPRTRSALDLSRQLYRDFKPQTQLIASGRNRLPAFRITKIPPVAQWSDLDAAASDAPFTVTVSIDEKNDELLIDATSRDADAVLKLLRSLDRSLTFDR